MTKAEHIIRTFHATRNLNIDLVDLAVMALLAPSIDKTSRTPVAAKPLSVIEMAFNLQLPATLIGTRCNRLKDAGYLRVHHADPKCGKQWLALDLDGVVLLACTSAANDKEMKAAMLRKRTKTTKESTQANVVACGNGIKKHARA